MSFREQLDAMGQGKERYDPSLPTGYDWRKQRRYVLTGGGYTGQCSRTNVILDFFNPVAYVVVRDVALGGIGVLSNKPLKVGVDYMLALPSGGSMRGQVVRSLPDKLFPKLYRSGIRWHRYPSVTQFKEWEPFIQADDLTYFERDYQLLMSLI
ncbi:hypothetical protein K3H46_00410 [Aeromonas veronii]|uniref:hypothetical protein n=1 Tax=Aeromonas veronii TaxID=654 RepID=UPI001F333465|nr:hypothetical protein [Aeromonas veronii]MCF5889490.1 hypothetical protein [Aeromonas veronii]